MNSHFWPTSEISDMLQNDPFELNILSLGRNFKNHLGEINCIVISYKPLPHMPMVGQYGYGGCYAFHPHLSLYCITLIWVMSKSSWMIWVIWDSKSFWVIWVIWESKSSAQVRQEIKGHWGSVRTTCAFGYIFSIEGFWFIRYVVKIGY